MSYIVYVRHVPYGVRFGPPSYRYIYRYIYITRYTSRSMIYGVRFGPHPLYIYIYIYMI